MVNITFYSAGGPSSGIEIDAIGSGTFDHVGCYGPLVHGASIGLGAAQDVSWLVDDAGAARKGGSAESGQLNNTKWADPSGVVINSGSREALPIIESGFATLRIALTDTGNFNVSGARLYAYDGSNQSNDPSGLWVLSAEVVPPAYSGNGDTEWAIIDSSKFNYMTDRVASLGYPAATEFNYFVMLSVRPKITAETGTQSFGLYFIYDVTSA